MFVLFQKCNMSLSLFIINIPFVDNPSNISNFAFKIFSLEPKLPIWAVPIFVITAIVGFAICVNKLISPKLLIPISTTKASSSFSFNIVSGNPIWLLKFPSVFNVLYLVDITLAIISFVLVFPTLPVTATTGILYKLLLYFAIFCNAFSVSSTSIIVLSEYLFLVSSLISTFCNMQTLAPASRACL